MIDDLHTSAHISPHMSPAEAAQIAGVSRWTIMRAIKSHDLQATRDNRNHWRISSLELDKWRSAHCAHSVPAQAALHTPTDSPETLAKLAAETARADAAERARDQAEADRDAWRAQAVKLADRLQQGGWWPWQRR
jgi:excisionase family DNA binding protein